MTGWLASLSDKLHTYGPVSYVFAGLASGLLFTIILLVSAKIREYYSRAKMNDIFTTVSRDINPLDSSFVRIRFRISDFETPFATMHNEKTVTGCEIIGPGIIFLSGCTVGRNNWAECTFVKFSKLEHLFTPVVAFYHSTFTHCTFYRITVMVHESQAASLEEGFPDGIQWIN